MVKYFALEMYAPWPKTLWIQGILMVFLCLYNMGEVLWIVWLTEAQFEYKDTLISFKLSTRGQDKTAKFLVSTLLSLTGCLSYDEAALKNMYMFPPLSLVLPRSQIWHFYGAGWFVLFLCSTCGRHLCGSLPCIPSSSFQSNFLCVRGCHGQILNYAPMGEVCNFTWL